jgi:UTP--glucose-1-phosphate uridylyltransferase
MTKSIRKAVFPVAGLGTRFLPATKANPKEMLPVVDKPLIQYAVEEAIEAGITDLIFVTGRTKRAIADHFDKAYELENELEKKNKTRMLDVVRNIVPAGVTCIYIRQAEALGLGHAVLCARAAVGNEPFAVLLADDLIHNNKKSCMSQMTEFYKIHHSSVIAVETVPRNETKNYGIVSVDKTGNASNRIKSIVEKPSPEKAPSNLAVVGRYILTPAIFDLLESTKKGAGGEIQLTDAIAELLKKEDVYSLQFEGTRYDCGSKLGYLQANVEYGLKHPELSQEFSEYLSKLTRN